MSDLHLEFGTMEFPAAQDTDAKTVLVLAGDIAVAKSASQYYEFILTAVERFQHVIWIMGNHEHYGGSVQRSIEKIKRAVGEHDNLSVVENEVVAVGNVDFICGTLWTDFANNNPVAMIQAQGIMNDYKKIRTYTPGGSGNPYGRKLRPADTVVWHNETLIFIVDSLEVANKIGRKTVVVTHHAPSHQSVPARFGGDTNNCAYASPLDALIMNMKPDYWIHGHIHDTQDYNIEHTNVLANPRGYFGMEINPQFDPMWTIDLS